MDKVPKKIDFCQPFLVTLQSIMVECFYCYSETSTRLDRSSTILFYPTFENTTKTTFTKKTFGPEVSGCILQVIKSEFLQLGCNFQFIPYFGSGWIASCITSNCGRHCLSGRRLFATIIWRFSFSRMDSSVVDGVIYFGSGGDAAAHEPKVQTMPASPRLGFILFSPASDPTGIAHLLPCLYLDNTWPQSHLSGLINHPHSHGLTQIQQMTHFKTTVFSQFSFQTQPNKS